MIDIHNISRFSTEVQEEFAAGFAIEGVIENKEINDGDYAGWDAALAVDVYIDHNFFETSGLDPEELDFDRIRSLVAADLADLIEAEAEEEEEEEEAA